MNTRERVRLVCCQSEHVHDEDLSERRTICDIIGDILFFLDWLITLLGKAVLCLVATLLLLSFTIVARIILFLLEL